LAAANDKVSVFATQSHLEAAAPDRSQSAASSKESSRDTNIFVKLFIGVSHVEVFFLKLKMQ